MTNEQLYMSSEQYYKKYGIFVEAVTSNVLMPAMHEHTTYEVYFLLHGDRTYFVEDRVFRLSDGELALIPPHVLHKTGGKTGNRILFAFTPEYLKKYYTDEAFNQLVSGFSERHRAPKKKIPKNL